ncbi:family 2 glycosyl hydrolase [Massarina eburnea CBS 473.64]|uniref:beta-galactosidase n=1 Tax=Massarina eburnea CBS 473.64 TaxID=1395130 RepID=A0A6A6S7C6_9PLEO|nr:family 2 glycosyl hydrolase [Massarina eburnea CBS 473.64]
MSTAVHPKDLPDWDNLSVIHRNALHPRSSFYLYPDATSALSFNTRKASCKLLSGIWKFNFATSPFLGPLEFYESGFNASKWAPILVPGHWQTQGLGGRPHYTNVPYPFPVDPPHIPYDDNETGRYLTTFHIDDDFAKDKQLRLRFEGVDSAFKLWVNGIEVGYSQGSRNPSEFDVTSHIRAGQDNVLAVEVYARCDGTYLEDQDQWWLSGIFRDVYIHAFPKVHPKDVSIQTVLDEKYQDATLEIDLSLSGDADIAFELHDKDGHIVAKTSKSIVNGENKVALPVSNPRKWTAETPYLYKLTISSQDFALALRVGFRSIEIIDGAFCVNGSPVKFRGVNRHEHHPETGRTVPNSFLKRDLLMIKEAGINAIRTSHYPNDPRFYDLADQLGFWVIDEADLECHGFKRIGEDRPERFTSDNAEWEGAYLDRARQLVYRDRNHASVVIWSLGNEAWYGKNHKAMYHWIKSVDSTRPIHYEQDANAETADMISVMYPGIDDVIKMATEENYKKPYVLSCVDEYLDIFYKYPRCMGGFLWEWSNHGLRTESRSGEEFFGYGGDFSDLPNDGAVLINGICTSDHNPAPSFSVYQKAIEPVKVLRLEGEELVIVNRYDFIGLDHLQCYWSIISDGIKESPQIEIPIPKEIKPHTEARLRIPDLPKSYPAETYLTIRFRSRVWANTGSQIAWGQILLPDAPELIQKPPTSSDAKPTVKQADQTTLVVTSSSGNSVWKFDLLFGVMRNWIRNDAEIIDKPFTLDLWRATIEPDRRSHSVQWKERRVDQTRYTTRKVSWDEADGSVIITIEGRVAPPVQAWGINLVTIYTILGDTLTIKVKGQPGGPNLPDTFPRIGLSGTLHNIAKAKWWGRGPGESYVDKKINQQFGNWESTVDDLWVEYEEPQESGNRTDVRWVEFLGKKGARILRASFGNRQGCSFKASHFSVQDVVRARHPYQLRAMKKKETFVRLDWVHQGTGSGLIETGTVEEKYKLHANKEFEFEVILE